MNIKINKKYYPPLILALAILLFVTFAITFFEKRNLSHLRPIDRWRKENTPAINVLREQTSTKLKVFTTINAEIGILYPVTAEDLAINLKSKLEALDPPAPVVIVSQE